MNRDFLFTAHPLFMTSVEGTEAHIEEQNTLPTSDEGTSSWSHIRELDEEENWAERTRVVSKEDHLLYARCAQVIDRKSFLSI